MTTLSLAVHDSAVMLRRNLLHMRRYPSVTFFQIGIPVMFLLLFVYIFGDTLGNGLGAAAGGRSAYVNYVVPGILMFAVAGAATGTAISVAMDMTEGIIARFRTMRIFRPSVLTGHVFGSLLQSMLALVVVTGVALLVGFRPTATPLEWLAAAGLLALFTFAVIWFAVGCGLAAKTVESASNMPMPLMLLPFLGSGFVPTDSMPAAVAWFARYQPFTPVIETVRGLLLGSPIGNNGLIAVIWSVAITVVCYLWSRRLYRRDPN
jgi:ABC-2 type transport system permease protein